MKAFMILSSLALTSTVSMSLARAETAPVAIRVPVLFEDSSSGQIIGASKLQEQFQAAGIYVPEFIEIESVEDAAKLRAIENLVETKDVKAPGSDSSLSVVRYGRVSSFQVPEAKYPMCYRRLANAPIKTASREALNLLASLTDSVLSDQYIFLATRFYDQTEFTFDGSFDDEDSQKMKDTYGKTRLRMGDIQIISATGDDGDDDAEDILPLCRN